MTIITPDEGGSFPAWAYDMATAIVAKNGTFDTTDANGDGIVDIVQNARIDLNGERQLVGSGQIARNILLFDWTAVSNQPGIADSSVVTEALNGWLERMPSLDVHFIGHGRGALVNMGVLRNLSDLAKPRLLHLQVTTLDAYARGDDGAFEANPGGIVDFADNYYQNTIPQQIQNGAPLLGALNFNLSEQLTDWSGRSGDLANHQEVHDWYHWTIAPELGDGVVPHADASLPVPNAAAREVLYDSYVADLNVDGAPDEFRSGANIGYYFTLAGGGFGNVVLVQNADFSNSLFTLDVITGELPLYLGRLDANPPDQIAYRPDGNLYYTDFNSQLARAQLQFDENGNPTWTRTLVGAPLGQSFGHTIEFAMNGQFARGESNVLMEISPDTGEILRSMPLDWGFATIGAMAFDSNYDLFLVRVPHNSDESASLVCFDTLALGWLGSFDIPYRDITQLSMVDGLLHAIRENGEQLAINPMTQKIVERAPLALPAGATLLSMTSTTDQVHVRWHNRKLPADVNEDGRVNSSDVLALINTLLTDGARSLDTNVGSFDLRSYQFDVTNGLRVNTSDVLGVINHILLQSVASTPAAAPLQELAPAELPLAAPPATAIAPAPLPESLHWIAFAASLELEVDKESEPDWWS